MQMKIIQIALGWKRERYSLEVSNWIRSKLRTPIATSRHELRWGGGEKHSTCIKYLSFCFGALACQYCHVVLPLTWGKPCFFSLTCALPICPLTIQTPIMAREAHPQYMAVPPCMTKMTGPTKTCPMRHTFAPFQPFCRYAAWSLAIIAPGYINPLHHGTCIQHGYWICRQSEPDILPTRDRP